MGTTDARTMDDLYAGESPARVMIPEQKELKLRPEQIAIILSNRCRINGRRISPIPNRKSTAGYITAGYIIGNDNTQNARVRTNPEPTEDTEGIDVLNLIDYCRRLNIPLEAQK